MTTMLNGDKVDVSQFISNGYSPIYCNGEIIKLYKLAPISFTDQQKDKLKTALEKWYLNNYAKHLNVDTVPHAGTIKYQYSYLITDHPVDVYMTEISIARQSIKLFIRFDKDSLITPYEKTNWVISKCDN